LNLGAPFGPGYPLVSFYAPVFSYPLGDGGQAHKKDTVPILRARSNYRSSHKIIVVFHRIVIFPIPMNIKYQI